VRAPTAPPVVVVGTTGDPATPVAWADSLARELGSGRLVTVEGSGHTSSLDGNPCLDRILERYLVDDRAPATGVRCPA
jgi:pimeloyl-ACP methyl ester carboxylesterase